MSSSDAIDVVVADGSTVVTVHGEFDMLLADRFVSSSLAGDGPVEVDLTAVTFLDSAGLSALAQVAAALDGEGRSLRVLDASIIARQVIGICGMDDLLGLGPAPA